MDFSGHWSYYALMAILVIWSLLFIYDVARLIILIVKTVYEFIRDYIK